MKTLKSLAEPKEKPAPTSAAKTKEKGSTPSATKKPKAEAPKPKLRDAGKTEKVDSKRMNTKWGATVIKAAGWSGIPNLLIVNQRRLKIDSVDLNILLILIKHWWDAGRYPFPSKDLISNITGRDKTTIQKHLRKMEELGILTRNYQYGDDGGQKNTVYNLDGLKDKLLAFAAEENEVKKERSELEGRKMRGRG